MEEIGSVNMKYNIINYSSEQRVTDDFMSKTFDVTPLKPKKSGMQDINQSV